MSSMLKICKMPHKVTCNIYRVDFFYRFNNKKMIKMKTYTDKEVVELLKKFDNRYTHNTNSDGWYAKWLKMQNENSVLSTVPLPIAKGHWEDLDNDGYDDTWVDDEA